MFFLKVIQFLLRWILHQTLSKFVERQTQATATDADNNNDDEIIICVLTMVVLFCETMELSRVVHLWQSSPTVLQDDGRYDNSNACKARISIRR